VAVSLERTTVDLEAIAGARAGGPVVQLGHHGCECVTMDTFAGWAGESPIQSLMRFSGRARVEFHSRGADRRSGATWHSSEEGR